MITRDIKVNTYSKLYEVIAFVCSDHKAIESFSAGYEPDFNDTTHVYPCAYFETGQNYIIVGETKRYTIALHLFDKLPEEHEVKDLIDLQTKLDIVLNEVVQELRQYQYLSSFSSLDIAPTEAKGADILVGIRAEFQLSIPHLVTAGDTPFKSKLTVVLPSPL